MKMTTPVPTDVPQVTWCISDFLGKKTLLSILRKLQETSSNIGRRTTLIAQKSQPMNCMNFEFWCTLCHLWYPRILSLGVDHNTVLMRYSSRWRLQRKILQQSFRQDVASKFRPMQAGKTHELLLNLLEAPLDYPTHLHA
jgi:cytochrome P450